MDVSLNRQKVLFGLAACAVVIALTSFEIISGHSPAPRPALPHPNGYDDFLEAASVLKGDVGNSAALDVEELRDLISTNPESLRLLRLGLTRQCALPADSAMTNVSGMLNELAGFKRLAQLLSAEGRFREQENNLSGAAGTYLDAIHFGNDISRGGFHDKPARGNGLRGNWGKLAQQACAEAETCGGTASRWCALLKLLSAALAESN